MKRINMDMILLGAAARNVVGDLGVEANLTYGAPSNPAWEQLVELLLRPPAPPPAEHSQQGPGLATMTQ